MSPFGESKPPIYLGRARRKSLSARAPIHGSGCVARGNRVNLLERYDYPISRFLYRPLSVYRLPGGVAATVGAVQPLMVVFISAALLGSPIRLMAVLGAICGTAGVALLVLTPNAALDPVGVAAGLAGAVSMAFGTVLTRKWQPPVPLLTFTAWQLAAGGLLLVPVALVFDPPIPMPTGTNVLGLAWLGLIGAGLTYFLWFRGISRLEPTVVSLLGFLSPGTAVLLGWLFLDQTLSALQIIGVLLVIGSIWLGQRSNRTPRARIACRKSP